MSALRVLWQAPHDDQHQPVRDFASAGCALGETLAPLVRWLEQQAKGNPSGRPVDAEQLILSACQLCGALELLGLGRMLPLLGRMAQLGRQFQAAQDTFDQARRDVRAGRRPEREPAGFAPRAARLRGVERLIVAEFEAIVQRVARNAEQLDRAHAALVQQRATVDADGRVIGRAAP